MVFSK